MNRPLINRRNILLGAGALTLTFGCGEVAFAAGRGPRKIVLIILRGALDGLALAPPYGDPNYAALRGKLAIAAPGEPNGALALIDGIGLHPRLIFVKECWASRQAAILHAASSPYRDRSHFDGQDVLENGGATVFGLNDGWLNRALALAPQKPQAVAIGGEMPLVLRGKMQVSSWSPSGALPVAQDTLMRLTDLYEGDGLLGPALAEGTQTAAVVGETTAMRGMGGVGNYQQLTQAAARLLAAPDGPATAVISLTGWDTHANQGAATGALAQRLENLDKALRALRIGLGAVWDQTVVIVATEFGRTVGINGTGGTDHGTGGAALVLGGAVKGGRFLGDWPGLAPNALYQNRDLAPANDLRSLFASVLEQHWDVDRAQLQTRVFPDASPAPMYNALIAT